MDIKDSSDEDEIENVRAFDNFDESIDVRNAEEVRSPNRQISKPTKSNRKDSIGEHLNSSRTTSSHGKPEGTSGRHGQDNNFGNFFGLGNDLSDSDESDDDDIQANNTANPVEIYDPKNFENLPVSPEVKELFQNIIRYAPQKIELNYKLIPFIPDYIPAVGDIDAFIKVPRPDGSEDKVGLLVLDEPCTDQSDPAVLHLQLRSQSKSAGAARQTLIKRIEDAEKNVKSIDKWIDDMNELRRSKHSLAVELSKTMPDIDSLMQQWPAELEEKLNESQLDFSSIDCPLPRLIDIVCTFFDIPVYPEFRLESLHTLFTLFLEIKNLTLPTNF